MNVFIRLLFILALVSASLMASIGKISALRGEATIERAKQEIVASMGMEIEKNDLIHTKTNSKLQIIFNDNTIITMGKNGDLAVNDYILDERKPKAEFKMFKGVFRTVTGQIGKIAPNRFKIKTKTATIGIRGTTVEVSTGSDGDAVGFSEGHGSVTSDATGETKDVGTGQMVTVTPDGKMSEVKVLDKKAFLNGDKKENKKAKKEEAKKEKKDKKKESKKAKKADKKESKKSDKKDAKKKEKKESKKETKSEKKADKKESKKSETKQTKSSQKKSKPEAKKSEAKSVAKSSSKENKSESKESNTQTKQEESKSEQSDSTAEKSDAAKEDSVRESGSDEKTDTASSTEKNADGADTQTEVATDGDRQDTTVEDTGTQKDVRGADVDIDLGDETVAPDGLDGGAQEEIAVEPVDIALDDTETEVPLDIPLDDVVVDDTATNDAASAATDGAIAQATDEAVADVINQDVQENVENVITEVVDDTDPIIDEPVVDDTDPIIDEPVVDDTDPIIDEPVVDDTDPIIDEPVVDDTDPIIDEPVVDDTDPTIDEPVVDDTDPIIDEPVVDDTDPIIDEPVAVSGGTTTTTSVTAGTYPVSESFTDVDFGYNLTDVSGALDATNISSYYITGINPLVSLPTQGEISYGGLVIGDSITGGLIDTSTSNFKIFVNFGSSAQLINGYMNLLTINGEAWGFGFNSGTTTSTTVLGMNNIGTNGEVATGILSGISFYGNKAQSIGGEFSIASASSSIEGVFIGNSADSDFISENTVNPSNIIETGFGDQSGEISFSLSGENIMSIGYWGSAGNEFDTWVNGILTDISQIETLIANNTGISYYVNSQVIGLSSTGDKLTNGAINLDINFGSPTPLSGQISFDTTSTWIADITTGGFVTPNGFGADAFSDGTSSGVTGISGFLNGSFFGTDAALVGGEFRLTGTNSGVEESVKGVYSISEGTPP